jgi:Transposase IS4
VYSASLAKTWLKGHVISLSSERKNDAAKRATSYVKARHSVGNAIYIKVLPLQITKAVLPEGGIDPTRALNEINADPPLEAEPPVEPPVEPSVSPPPPPPLPPPPQPIVAETVDEEELLQEEEAGVGMAPLPVGRTPPVSVNHGREWFTGETEVDVNGPVPFRYWKMTDQYNHARTFFPGCDDDPFRRSVTPFDCFMACFPRKQLKLMVTQTTLNLREDGKVGTRIGELLKWFGVSILMTMFEFGDRSTLWERKRKTCKYIPPPEFGQTGMSRDRYDHINRHLVWSSQPAECPEGMRSDEWRWKLIQDFVTRFNEHRKSHYTPSSVIVVDESISRWYGLGGHWINMGLPMYYVAIDRKPDNGCDIQNAADGRSGIMMQLSSSTILE